MRIRKTILKASGGNATPFIYYVVINLIYQTLHVHVYIQYIYA